MIPRIISGSLMRATPPWARISAGTRSSAITATAPAYSAILACSGVTTSMITPPLSICASPALVVQVDLSIATSSLFVRSFLLFCCFLFYHRPAWAAMDECAAQVKDGLSRVASHRPPCYNASAAHAAMPDCVMVALRTLDPSVQVRILVRQPRLFLRTCLSVLV